MNKGIQKWQKAKYKRHARKAKKLNGDCFDSQLERIVASELNRQGLRYVTQFNTLQCINPSTGCILPYDFEIPEYKIIIEVQGAQHFTWCSRFDDTEDKFIARVHRDDIKKEYAISSGYTFIALDEMLIFTGEFRHILQEAVKKQSHIIRNENK